MNQGDAEEVSWKHTHNDHNKHGIGFRVFQCRHVTYFKKTCETKIIPEVIVTHLRNTEEETWSSARDPRLTFFSLQRKHN